MAIKPISAEDFINIFNLLGTYQQLVDDADDEGWTSLFTEDGEFTGFGPPLQGREQLKAITGIMRTHAGRMRHHMASLSIQYGDTKDEAIAKFYSLLTTWAKGEAPKLHTFAICKMRLLRLKGEWKVRSNEIQTLSD